MRESGIAPKWSREQNGVEPQPPPPRQEPSPSCPGDRKEPGVTPVPTLPLTGGTHGLLSPGRFSFTPQQKLPLASGFSQCRERSELSPTSLFWLLEIVRREGEAVGAVSAPQTTARKWLGTWQPMGPAAEDVGCGSRAGKCSCWKQGGGRGGTPIPTSTVGCCKQGCCSWCVRCNTAGMVITGQFPSVSKDRHLPNEGVCVNPSRPGCAGALSLGFWSFLGTPGVCGCALHL